MPCGKCWSSPRPCPCRTPATVPTTSVNRRTRPTPCSPTKNRISWPGGRCGSSSRKNAGTSPSASSAACAGTISCPTPASWSGRTFTSSCAPNCMKWATGTTRKIPATKPSTRPCCPACSVTWAFARRARGRATWGRATAGFISFPAPASSAPGPNGSWRPSWWKPPNSMPVAAPASSPNGWSPWPGICSSTAIPSPTGRDGAGRWGLMRKSPCSAWCWCPGGG